MVLIKKIGIALLTVGLAFQGLAQKVDTEEIERLKKTYPEENVIYKQLFEVIDLSVHGDSIYMISTRKEHRYYSSDQSSGFSKDQVHSNSFYTIKDLEAYTLIPEGKRYKRLEVNNFKESSNLDSYVFFDDSKTKSFIYPGIQPGAESVLSYQEINHEPRFGASFYFQTFLPIDHARFRIITDPEIDIEFSEFHLEGYDIKLSEETSKDGRKIYTYDAHQMQKRRMESNAPRINYFVPHVVMRIRQFTTDGGQTEKVLESTAELYAWYQEFVGEIATKNDPEVQKIVDTLIDDDDSDLEKVRKIFYWVQENIKYIAFEDGMRGFVPHPGGYVCEKRYGDCKDMASIIVNMLHHAGVEAYFTWIGTRNLPYRYSELPTPMVDNHMIAAYEADGKVYFLDATAQYLSFPMPSAMIQGKEALIGKQQQYEIVEVPVIPAEENVMNDTIRMQIRDKSISGTGKVTLSGYARTFNAYRMIKSDEIKVEKYLNNLLAKGNNKFLIDEYDISNLYDPDKPIAVDYTFNLPDYHSTINDEIYINLNMDKAFQNGLIENDRELPIENDYAYTNQTISILEIPENYVPSYLPADSSFENDVFSFSITYEQQENEIIMNRTFKVKYLLLTPSEFDMHNEAIKKLNNAYREAVVLGKKQKQ